MKICWDNLEKLRYSQRTGKWYQGSHPYVYIELCKKCNEEYLTYLYKKSDFCTYECSTLGSNNNFYKKNHSNESRKKMSKAHKGRNNPSWKGGYNSKNIPTYDTYAPQIEYAEKVRRNIDDENILEVKCAYCGKWHIPKRVDIQSRISFLNGRTTAENRLYCSTSCKNECPIYKKVKYSAEETNSKRYSREVQPELRQLVFERDNWECKKCGNTKSLHCHHITGIELNPIESADIDNCITYCKKCHKEVHKQDGCKYVDMRRKECKEKI